MKCNPWRWLWGIPLLGMWLWITVLAERDNIQDDLRGRSQTALSQAGFSWATPSFAGRDGLVTGRTVNSDEPDKAIETVRDVWGVRVANKDIEVIEKVSNYEWSATREGGEVVLGGFVPSDEDRADIVAYFTKRFPKLNVVDQMVLTPGIADKSTWLTGVRFAGKQLVSLDKGSAKLRNSDLSVTGAAQDFVAYKGVKAALARALPEGITLVKDGVSPPVAAPYTWSAKRSLTGLLLSGHVPSEELRRDIFARTKELFKDTAIVDRMQTAAGAPKAWSTAAFSSLEQLLRLQKGLANMSDQNLQLSGAAVDQATAESIRTAWNSAIPSSFELTDNLTYPKPVPPVATPFVTDVLSEESNVVVKGYVPSDDVRVALLEQVRNAFPGRTTIDKLELASGAPDGWNSCIAAGLGGLAKLDVGQLSLRDRNLLVVGKTKDEALVTSLPNEVRVAANRACDTEVRVAADVLPEPTLEWSAKHQGEGRIVLSGSVPDAATKAALIERVGKLFTGAEIIDEMTIAGVEPRNWKAAAVRSLEQLARLRSGEAIISRQDVLIRGEAKDTAIATAVKDRIMTSLPKEYGGRHDIKVLSDAQIWAEEEARKKAKAEKLTAEARAQAEAEAAAKAKADAQAQAQAAAARKRQEEAEAEARRLEGERKAAEEEAERLRKEAAATERARQAELDKRKQEANKCETLLRSAAAEGSIQFGWASAELTRQSRPTLARLASIAKQCPGFAIEIGGHTDAEGTPERNKSLAERRAQSVVDYLKSAGVDGDRLVAVGYGETLPIAANDTAAGRAKNRRIEFVVKAN